ncbi:MAG: GDSL-type esterase/lipase family protein [Candidatus Omnitrophota bacterium]|nr:GDSL-type esterase/lipase family protein [Candidatus Omnitrophota bacterium]
MSINKALIFVIIILCFVASGCSQRQIKNLDSTGENIICFGNSITAGSGAAEGEDYPSLLSKKLDIAVVNAGIGGNTSFDGLKRIKADVLNKKPLLVVVEFGGNDFLLKIPLKDTLKNIDEIVRIIQEQGAIVVLLDVKASFFMNGYKSGYRKIAKKRGAIFIPNIISEILSNPNLKSDYIHPNAQGYQILAQRILAVIKPCLIQNKGLRAKNN